MKTMTKIVSTESQNTKDFKIPDKNALDLLAASSAGDIRACINSLQFYCTNGKILIADSSFSLSKDMIIFSSKKIFRTSLGERKTSLSKREVFSSTYLESSDIKGREVFY